MKLQIAFRDMRHERRDTAVAVGLAEYPAHAAPREMIAAFQTLFENAGVGFPDQFVDLNAYRFPMDEYGGVEDYASYDVSGLVTERIWRDSGGHSNCELFLRETRVLPSRGDAVVMAFAGMVGCPDGCRVDEESVLQYSKEDGVFVFEGRVGEDLKPEWGAPRMKERMTGDSLMSFLRQHVWGFGMEPVGLPSAMHLGFLDGLDEYRELEFATSRSPAEEARYGVLEPEMRRIGMKVEDGEYREFLSAMHEKKLVRSASAPETKEEADAVSIAAAEIVRELATGEGMSMC